MPLDSEKPDYSLCAITTEVVELGRTHDDVARAAISGGATIIQFRDKDMDDSGFEKAARRIGNLAKENGILFIVNDRVDIAGRCGAHGVHIGQEDLALEHARLIMGLDAIIGVSVSKREEALKAEAAGADYLGVGPVFETGSKSDAKQPIGLDGLSAICQSVIIPVIAIGGITNDNAREVMAAGAAGIAVIAAIAEAPDMIVAAGELRGCVK